MKKRPFKPVDPGKPLQTEEKNRRGYKRMKTKLKLICFTSLALIQAFIARAEYKETMEPNGLTKNLVTDFKMVDDNAKGNQSEKLQEAIDRVAKKGGGKLLLPKGTYRFSGINLKSNVHLLIEKDTVIKPWWPTGTKTVVFVLDGEEGHIENVSIRGVGGKFIVDYSDRGSNPGEGIRAVNCKQVKNFMVSDLYVKDSFTTYCAVIFTPAKGEPKKGAIFRPTDGLVKNLKSTDSSPGYGLVQMHAGERIHFENLEAYGGGVTFRLETGSGGLYGGIHDITAKNIYCENGSTAVLMGPHTAQNGMVTIDGVIVKSCAFAVTMGSGFIEKKNEGNPNYKKGVFADGSTVRNVHAIFGTNAAVSLKGLVNVPKEYLKDLRIDENDRKQKRVRGPSVGVVRDGTENSWKPIIENVTEEGFKYNKGVTKGSKTDRINWRDALEGTPLLEQLSKNPPQIKKGRTEGGKKKRKSKSDRKKK